MFPFRILPFAFRSPVHCTINLYDQLHSRTIEISYVWSDGLLTSELRRQNPSSKGLPEFLFCHSRGLAESFCPGPSVSWDRLPNVLHGS